MASNIYPVPTPAPAPVDDRWLDIVLVRGVGGGGGGGEKIFHLPSCHNHHQYIVIL